MSNNENKPKNIIDPKIRDLINELKDACYMKRIPMFMAFVESNTDSETKYLYEILTGNTCDMKLTDDKIIDFSNVINGAKVMFKEDIDVIDTEDFFGPVVQLDTNE